MKSRSKLAFLFFLLIFTDLAYGRAQRYEISLLTCDEGEEIYTSFGHSAVRVRDPLSGEDLVYNYGTFDFGAPNFVLNFAGGRLDYFLSVTTFERFISEYNYFGRSVREQVLDLNEVQARDLVQFLQTNYLPENRNYRYDFFFENCATRIRDVMTEILGDQLVWNEDSQLPVEKSFRELIDEKVRYMPWSDLGIDIAPGSRLDRDATPWEEQFLPSYMELAFGSAEIVGDGPSRPLVKQSRVILDFPSSQEKMAAVNPYWIFWVVAIVFTAVSLIGSKKKKLFIAVDLVLFGTLGIIGLVLAALWIGSDIPSTKWNWNILWAFPGHLALVWGLLRCRSEVWVRKYLLFALILADAAVVFWILGWQSFHPSLIPILLVVILRTNYLYYNIGSQRRKIA